jgi:hypothetical protein
MALYALGNLGNEVIDLKQPTVRLKVADGVLPDFDVGKRERPYIHCHGAQREVILIGNNGCIHDEGKVGTNRYNAL